nr:MAG TPA: hypothetical protein [Caudoviricetes sp.]DAZ51619.1 MAG TPA: hypothetical protein [Caudoviricetes sp.]
MHIIIYKQMQTVCVGLLAYDDVRNLILYL